MMVMMMMMMMMMHICVPREISYSYGWSSLVGSVTVFQVLISKSAARCLTALYVFVRG